MAAGAVRGLHRAALGVGAGPAGAPPQRPACTEAGDAGMGLHYAALGACPKAGCKPPDHPVNAEAAAAGAGAHYAALGVGPDASPEQLRGAYRAAVLRLHPDKAPATGGGGAAGARFQDVQLAWEVRSQQRACRIEGCWLRPVGKRYVDATLVDVQIAGCDLL